MSSPLCKARPADEPPRPGDVVAIRSGRGAEVHGFVYLMPELAFSKNGSTNGAPYSLQSPDEVFDTYQVDRACRRIEGVPRPPLDCPVYANYFSCKTVDQYLSERKSAIPADFTELNQGLAALECQVAKRALFRALPTRLGPESAVNPADFISFMAASLEVIEELAQRNSADERLSEED